MSWIEPMAIKHCEQPKVVWTSFVRFTHWVVAFCVLGNFFNDTGFWHRMIGYICLGIVLSRIFYGKWISRHGSSRFYLPTILSVKLHLLEMRSGRMAAHHGHNPLGQLAVYLMWLIIMLLGLTGWVSRTDTYWGEDWPVNLHQFLSQTLMLLVVLHLIAIFTVSYMSRRHLLKQMIDGKQHEL